MTSFQIKNSALCDILFDADKQNWHVDYLINYIDSHYELQSDEQLKTVREKLDRSFLSTFKSKMKSSFYSISRFKTDNASWLLSDFIVKFDARLKAGRPRSEDYSESSKSTKHRKLQSITDIYSSEEIKDAFYKNLKASGKRHLIDTIENLLNETTTDNSNEDDIIPFTPHEALALIEDAQLSKWQYDTIRKRMLDKNVNILMPFKMLGLEREKCYPPTANISVTEKGVNIDLQALLDHTCKRILEIQDVLPRPTRKTKNEIHLTLTSKWGCDGASGQSQFKQKFSDSTLSDESIFMSSLVPLTLKVKSQNSQEDLWRNPQPGSTRYCRPISFEYVKESHEKIVADTDIVKSNIDALLPTTVQTKAGTCKVHHNLQLTMIDGKVRQALTGTPSSASCCICLAKPVEMNDLKAIGKKVEREEYFEYGLSTLHAWIRFMECILHISYRLSFRQWSARTEEHKREMKQAKERIQNEFRLRTGLLVDYPRQGSGSSNDGNTARRFFRDPKLTSEITNVNEQLIERFGIILQCLASGYEIDSIKFDEYAQQTAKLYVESYDWYYMPSSVHTILFHGAKIIDHFLLIPIGTLSEEAQESRNKDVKNIRQFHTRKCGRVETNTDLIHKLLISSDPYISSIRQKPKNTKIALDETAKNLLRLT